MGRNNRKNKNKSGKPNSGAASNSSNHNNDISSTGKANEVEGEKATAHVQAEEVEAMGVTESVALEEPAPDVESKEECDLSNSNCGDEKGKAHHEDCVEKEASSCVTSDASNDDATEIGGNPVAEENEASVKECKADSGGEKEENNEDEDPVVLKVSDSPAEDAVAPISEGTTSADTTVAADVSPSKTATANVGTPSSPSVTSTVSPVEQKYKQRKSNVKSILSSSERAANVRKDSITAVNILDIADSLQSKISVPKPNEGDMNAKAKAKRPSFVNTLEYTFMESLPKPISDSSAQQLRKEISAEDASEKRVASRASDEAQSRYIPYRLLERRVVFGVALKILNELRNRSILDDVAVGRAKDRIFSGDVAVAKAIEQLTQDDSLELAVTEIYKIACLSE